MKTKKELSVAPLSGGFMISAIVGFIISARYVFPQSESWGFTFMLFFGLMFISSMISMTYGPINAQLHVGGERYRELKKKSNKKKVNKKRVRKVSSKKVKKKTNKKKKKRKK